MQVDVFEMISQFLWEALFAAGLYKLFSKCGKKGWWALVPGLRYLRLGECAGKEREGRALILLDISSIVLTAAFSLMNQD